MSRYAVGRGLAVVAALGYFGTAWLHSTGFGPVSALARAAPPDLETLVPALWLSFSADLAVVGLIVAAVAWRPTAVGRVVLALAALAPLSAAGLQLRFIGFVAPTAILIGLGGITLVAAAVMEGERKE